MSLRPMHPSVIKKRTVYTGSIRPNGMEKLVVTSEQREVVEKVALEIFTDMINAGATFQETLAAIYVSGAKHMAFVCKDQ